MLVHSLEQLSQCNGGLLLGNLDEFLKLNQLTFIGGCSGDANGHIFIGVLNVNDSCVAPGAQLIQECFPYVQCSIV
jgi:hypothetical protein